MNAHKKILHDFDAKLEYFARTPLINAGFSEDEAREHASKYCFDFMSILEGLLEVWLRFAARRSQPYPTVKDL